MDISVRRQSGINLLILRGDFKLGQAVDEFRSTVTDLVDNGEFNVVVNLAEVPMMDSSGIGILVRSLTSVKQRGGSLKLVQPSKMVVQTLTLVGLLNLFPVFDSDAEAVASFAQVSAQGR